MRTPTEVVLPGDPPVSVLLRYSARARRITLRISSLDGRVTLTVPNRVAAREALDFAASRGAWIRKHLAQRAPMQWLLPGGDLPVAGTPHVIVAQEKGAPRLGDGQILVRAGRPVGAQVRAVLKDLARARLAGAVDHYAALAGRERGKITLRDTRSRWGSCSSKGDLMFSWRLILAPPLVLDYVAAHEVAHLLHMDHSPAFWAAVARLMPDYAPHRVWLRQNGSALHAYRFDD